MWGKSHLPVLSVTGAELCSIFLATAKALADGRYYLIRCSRQLWKSSVEQSDPANSTLERIPSSSSKLVRILHHHRQEHDSTNPGLAAFS